MKSVTIGSVIEKDNSSFIFGKMEKRGNFSVIKYIFRIAILISLEISKSNDGQIKQKTLCNIAFFSVFLVAINHGIVGNFAYLLILVFEVFETSTWAYTQTPITESVILSLNIKYIFQDQFKMFILVNILFLITIAISFIKFENLMEVYISLNTKHLILLISIPMIYSFLTNIKHNIDGENKQVLINQISDNLATQLYRMLKVPPKIIQKKKQLKNLIILQLESIETMAIRKDTMPFLFNLTQQYLYYDNIEPTMYTAQTAAATLITQCGIPQIVADLRWAQNQKYSIGSYQNLSCLTDYLRTVGYECILYSIDTPSVHGISEFTAKKFEKDYNIKSNDPDLFDKLVRDYLPKYNKIGEKKHFMTLIKNEDTHFLYVPKAKCKPENTNAQAYRQMHNCLDQEIRKFVKTFFELKMNRHTVLVIYPDHLMMKNFRKKRRLFMLFPGFPKGQEKSVMTYYDVLPTLLEAVGIVKYEPGVAFGASAFSPEIGNRPTYEDYNLMYQFFSQTLNISRGATTFNCGSYSSNKLCNFTYKYVKKAQ